MAILLKHDLEDIDKADIASHVASSLGLKTKGAVEYLRIALANAKLMDRKQLDYGSENISDFGLYGVVIKINDKTKRLKHLMTTGRKRKAQNEAIVDSLRDLSIYAIIGLIVDAGTWPNE